MEPMYRVRAETVNQASEVCPLNVNILSEYCPFPRVICHLCMFVLCFTHWRWSGTLDGRTFGETLELVGKLAGVGLTDAEIGKAMGLAPHSVKEVRELVGKAIGVLEGSVVAGTAPHAGDHDRPGKAVSGKKAERLPKAGKPARRDVTEAMVARLAKAGKRDAEIAGILGLSIFTVGPYRRASGILRRPEGDPSRKIPPEIAQVVEMAASGMVDAEIAKLLELSVETVAVYRSCGKRLSGNPPRGFGRLPEVAALVREGLVDKEVAARTGLSLATVQIYRRKAGLERRLPERDAGRPGKKATATADRTKAKTVELVGKLALGGMPDAEIAERLGLSRGSMRQYRHLAGVVDKERCLGPAKVAEIPVLAREGLTDGEIAARFGCHSRTVSEHRRSAGILRNQRSGETRAMVARLAKDGKSDAEIAGLLGLAAGTVRKYRIKAGVLRQVRIDGGRTENRVVLPPKVVKVMEMAARGLSDKEIAKLLEVSPKTVSVYRSWGKRL